MRDWWTYSTPTVDHDDEEPAGHGRTRPRGTCTCTTPNPSARPAGRLRHLICRTCHKTWQPRIEELLLRGLLVYGITRKHHYKLLWTNPQPLPGNKPWPSLFTIKD